jgi:alpha-glucuronidase
VSLPDLPDAPKASVVIADARLGLAQGKMPSSVALGRVLDELESWRNLYDEIGDDFAVALDRADEAERAANDATENHREMVERFVTHLIGVDPHRLGQACDCLAWLVAIGESESVPVALPPSERFADSNLHARTVDTRGLT